MWMKSYSARQIAEKLGNVTRNAVMEKPTMWGFPHAQCRQFPTKPSRIRLQPFVLVNGPSAIQGKKAFIFVVNPAKLASLIAQPIVKLPIVALTTMKVPPKCRDAHNNRIEGLIKTRMGQCVGDCPCIYQQSGFGIRLRFILKPKEVTANKMRHGNSIA